MIKIVLPSDCISHNTTPNDHLQKTRDLLSY